jgi:benzoyl-CoA reductase subunit D
MIVAGIDCGAKNTKAVILRDGAIVGRGLVATGFEQTQAVKTSLKLALLDAGAARTDVACVAGTGAGAGAIIEADIKVNDIKAIAAAAAYFFPTSRTVLDLGAEESRVVSCDERGHALDFAVNEKCAAGSGAFFEAMARALETPLEEIGALALSSDKEITMNAQCTIFAESEVVGLIHANTAKKDIAKAIHDAMAGRIASMMRRVGVTPDIVVMGGVAKNPAFVAALAKELAMDHILVPAYPEFGAATGAALVAAAGVQE